MTKIEVKAIADKYNMTILRNPVTSEAHGVYCDTENDIPELDAISNTVDWHNPAPGQVAVERQAFGPVYRYTIHCPTSWFDLWGWREKKSYFVLPEYRDLWSNDPEWDGTVDEKEIERLSREWGKSVEELMKQVGEE